MMKAKSKSRNVAIVMAAIMVFSMVMLLSAMNDTAYATENDLVTKAEWIEAIETTYELGEGDILLLPENFLSDPEELVTREFAASTVNFFMGYELNQGLNYSFTDTAEVIDKNSAEYAVRKGIMTLDEGKFCPAATITVSEMESMLPLARQLWIAQYSMVDTYGDDAIGVAGLVEDYDLAGGVRHTLFIPNTLNGKTVKYIESGAYQNNTDITYLHIPETVIQIGSNAFKGCKGLTGTLTIPEQITEMGGYAFGNCTNITKVIIPVDFKYTYDSAPFYGCKGVTEIYYTKGQTGIMRDVSTVNSDTANYYSARLEYSTKDSLEKVSFEEGITRIGNDAYYNPYNSSNTYPCTKLETVILPESLTEIGSNAFRKCTSLNDITLPEGLEELGAGCFWGCTSLCKSASPDETMTLEDIGMPASLETIPANCFNGCTGIEGTLTIPEQITEMGGYAFGNCTNITKVIIPVDFKYTYDSAPFYGCKGVTEIYYTKGQTGIMRDVSTVNSDTANYYSARLEYSTKDSLEKVSFEEGITRIGSDAYYNPYNSSNTYPCTKLETVILPESLTEIGSNAFKGCTALEKLYGYKTSPEGTCGETYAVQNNLDFVPLDYPVFTAVPLEVGKNTPTQYSAVVHLSPDPDDDTTEDITWLVSENSTADTAITEAGVLTVALKETAETLTVSAVYDNRSTNSVQVSVIRNYHAVSLTGEMEASENIEHGWEFDRPTDFEKKGYDYKYYLVDGDYRSEITADQWPLIIENDVTIDVTRTEIFFNITYHLDEGINDPDNPEKYSAVTGIVSLRDPSKTHYTFKGWFTTEDGNERISEDNTYEGDLHAYARWEFIPHDFSEEWSSDDEYHWHKCMIVNCDAVYARSPHDWSDWVVTKEATSAEEGEESCFCKQCGKTNKRSISKKNSIQNAEVVLSETVFVYNGKVQIPAIETIKGLALEEGIDYTTAWSNESSLNAGTYTITIEGTGAYDGTTQVTYMIDKAANPLIVKPKTSSVKYSKLKKKAQTLKVAKVISFTKDAKDKKTYTLSSAKKGKKNFKKYFKISESTGKVTVKKGLKKGTYKVKVKVKALGNANYKASAEKTVTFTVKVK